MKYLGPISKDLKGPGADDYLAQARVLLGQARADMQLGGVKQGWRSYDMPNGTKIRVYSNHNGAVPIDKVWIETHGGESSRTYALTMEHGYAYYAYNEFFTSWYFNIATPEAMLLAKAALFSPLEFSADGKHIKGAAPPPALHVANPSTADRIRTWTDMHFHAYAQSNFPEMYTGLARLLMQALLGVIIDYPPPDYTPAEGIAAPWEYYPRGRTMEDLLLPHKASLPPSLFDVEHQIDRLNPRCIGCVRAPGGSYWLIICAIEGLFAGKLSVDYTVTDFSKGLMQIKGLDLLKQWAETPDPSASNDMRISRTMADSYWLAHTKIESIEQLRSPEDSDFSDIFIGVDFYNDPRFTLQGAIHWRHQPRGLTTEYAPLGIAFTVPDDSPRRIVYTELTFSWEPKEISPGVVDPEGIINCTLNVIRDDPYDGNAWDLIWFDADDVFQTMSYVGFVFPEYPTYQGAFNPNGDTPQPYSVSWGPAFLNVFGDTYVIPGGTETGICLGNWGYTEGGGWYLIDTRYYPASNIGGGLSMVPTASPGLMGIGIHMITVTYDWEDPYMPDGGYVSSTPVESLLCTPNQMLPSSETERNTMMTSDQRGQVSYRGECYTPGHQNIADAPFLGAWIGGS